VDTLALLPGEIGDVRALLAEVKARHAAADEPAFLDRAFVYAAELPRRIREFVNDFKHLEPSAGACLISGYPIDDAKLGPTPPHWDVRPEPSPTLDEELLLVLYGALLGDLLAWATQQNGFVVHNILPIVANAHTQLGSNSEQLLWWHTEDAFHPLRGDYLVLSCLRNPDRVATTLACIDRVPLDERHVRTLFEDRFVFRPDESHRKDLRSERVPCTAEGDVDHAYDEIQQRVEHGERGPILFGHPARPYVRVDPYFMDPPEDPDARAAFDWLTTEIEARLTEVVLQPGDALFVDNFRAVHGRKPFRARFDGSDRWLKRINVARDLRKSRAARVSATSRTIL
jgi:Fe(II)/alpha-ketoglutarate-dependent arginine beta-hydroxylase